MDNFGKELFRYFGCILLIGCILMLILGIGIGAIVVGLSI